jgi:hypothetical protein
VAGLLLRAAAPLGYMPASVGSGLLFEMCPGQLPAGLVLPGATPTHKHHHHGTEAETPDETDTCQIGHLLLSASVVGDIDTGEFDRAPPVPIAALPATAVQSAARLHHRPRGPPA